MSIVNEPNPNPRSPLLAPLPRLRPRRRWWWRWSLRVFLALLLAVTILFLYYAHRRREALVALRAAVAELDRTEPGWRLHELEAARAIIPNDENSALIVNNAFGLLPENWQSPDFFEHQSNLSPQQLLDQDDLTDLREELRTAQPALLEARKLATMPKGRYPITYKRNFISTPHPGTAKIREILALLYLDVVLQAQEGDVNVALRSCRALLNTVRSLGDEPMLTTQMSRGRELSAICKMAQRVLAHGEAEPEELLQLQKLVEEEDHFPRLLLMLRADRACMHELFDALECGDVTLREFGLAVNLDSQGSALAKLAPHYYFRVQHPRVLALQTDAVRLAALPERERAGAFAAFDRKIYAEPPGFQGMVSALSLTELDESARQTNARLRCLIAALAAERYRRRYGSWPQTLEGLVPVYLPAVPLDPYDGQPLRYQRLADRRVIYSLFTAPTKVSAPTAYDPTQPSPPGVGIAVHLYDVKHRRQPFAELLPPPAMDDEPRIRGIDP
jgi:hypothetical protein